MQIPVVRGRRARATCLAVVAAVLAAVLAGGFIVAGTARSGSAATTSIVEKEPPDVTTTSHSTASHAAVRPATAVAEAAQTSGVEVPDVNDVNDIPVAVAALAAVEAPVAVEAAEFPPVTEEVTGEVAEAVADVAHVAHVADVADVAADVDAVPTTTTTNQSTCRTDLAGAVMTIAMPDISYWCPVYAGGQSVIDAGVATIITAQGWGVHLTSHPGAPGTLWITGHRSSHGGAFAAVPDLRDGAIITVSDENRTASYVIVGRSYVEIRDGLAVDASGQATEAATFDAVLRPDRNGDRAARLLLQTCEGENFRWMIYADLIED